MEGIRTKVEITQKIALGAEIVEIYEIVDENENPKKSMWKVSYESNYPSEFCDKTGSFKSCLDCAQLVFDDEEKLLCHCARSNEKVSYKVMEARIKRALDAGCSIKIF